MATAILISRKLLINLKSYFKSTVQIFKLMRKPLKNPALILIFLLLASCGNKSDLLITDIYNQPLPDVEIVVYHAGDTQSENILFAGKSNSSGIVKVKNFDHAVQLAVAKDGYMRRSMLIEQAVMPGKIILPPGQAGLYHKQNHIPKQTYKFNYVGMRGMMIPAYYDGTYFVTGQVAEVSVSAENPLYLVAEPESSMAMNVFKGKEAIYIAPLQHNGLFARYNQGKKTSQKIDFEYEPIINDTDYSNTGLVQTSIKVFKINKLPKGDFVLFFAGGGPMDIEPRPVEENGCYPFRNL